MKKLFLLAWSTLLSVCVSAAELTVMEQGALVKDGFHNAFPSITAYQGKLYMAHRKATGHRRYDGVTALYVSADNGKTFQKVREFTGNGDMRDPRLCIVEGKLVIYNGCGHPQKDGTHKYSLKAFRSSDGKNFEEFTVKGLAENSFFWGCVPFEKGYIATSYKRVGDMFRSSLYYSTDGANFTPYLTFPGSGNETSLCPGKDGNLYCIVRREGGDCRPVYYVVKNKKIVKSVKLSEPLQGIMLTANGDSFIVGARHWDWSDPVKFRGRKGVRLDLFTMDKAGKLKFQKNLKSAGDCSYSFAVPLSDKEFFIVYYSQHDYMERFLKEKSKTPLTDKRPADICFARVKSE